MRNQFILLLLFCFCHTIVLAQSITSKNIDSLLIVLKNSKEDAKKVSTLNELSRQLIVAADYEKALHYANSALLLADKLNDKEGKAWTYNVLGSLERNKSNYSGALNNFNTALKIMEEIGHKRGVAVCYVNIGIVNDAQGKYPEAFNNHLLAFKIYKEIGNKEGIASYYGNISNIYIDQGNYPEALENRLKALRIHQETGNKESIGTSYYDIGRIYINLHNYQEALKNLLAALKIREEVGGKRTIAGAYHNIGIAYGKLGNYQEALKNHLSALKIQEQVPDKRGIANSYTAIGTIYEKQGNYPEALKNHLGSLKIREEIGDKQGIAVSYINAGSVISKQAAFENTPAAKIKYNEALKYLNKGLLLAKEIGTKESVKDAYNYMAETNKGMNDYKKALEYKNLYSEIKDSILNNEIARSLEQLRTQYEVEKSLKEEKIKNEAVLAEQKTELERKNELFLLMGFSIFAIITFFIVFFNRQRNQKRRAIEKAEVGHKIAELELQSLRSQLNPHFMFNSLNAIQDLILKEDIYRSHLYLSRFSKLLRILLDNANQAFVSVRQEIDFLELYLSLENLRIPDLQFSIEKDPKLNAEERMIPNMMLQPYIENAIWQGLSHKKENRKLQIRIHENGSATEFEVEDNGVGRKKAAEKKSLYRKGHHSIGMELLSKRFSLLAKEYGETIHTSVTDLVNNGDAAGTLVTITVPFSLSEQVKHFTHDKNNNN